MAQRVKKDKELYARYKKGRTTYSTYCAACHQPNGKGKSMMAPQLAQSDWVNGPSDILIKVVVHGLTGPIEVNGKPLVGIPPVMPPHAFLDDQQMADVLTYVRTAWNNPAAPITAEDVKSVREANPDRAAMWTQSELRP